MSDCFVGLFDHYFSVSTYKKIYQPGIVVHDYNLSYLEGRNKRVMIPGQPGQKGSKTLTQNKMRSKRLRHILNDRALA
jgi:hypothetical protein